MKYDTEIVIDLARAQVVELFDNPDNMSKWQPGFVSMEHFEGEYGQAGAKSKLVYDMNNRRLEMVETIVTRNLPDEFSATFEAPNVWNLSENFFTEIDVNSTKWLAKNEFKCSGMVGVMAFFVPWMFKRQTLKNMKDFKAFAEEEAS